MRLEIADTPVSPRHLAAEYKAARQRLLTAAPKPKLAPVVLKPLPDFYDPMAILWSPRLNAGKQVAFRYGNATVGVSLTMICRAVCEHFYISHIDLCSHRRTGNLVKPRHIVAWLARKYTGRSFPEIARLLGNRDHTTLLNSIRRISSDYAAYREDIEAVQRRMGVD